ncbi:DUF1684 domain-containing protein [Calidifontibacter sp. DB0510]|uniref:DUF1684 domain-containing protein n=1 Tax=Metallococcus carri TaxID=1656884 RepID=A0A967EHV4_9MICO|nr:DUF1684 domain-containing protein [Metallococcus carri]NHN57183.1 DUF1684 domain-containing protein [Metallococcus carri]NOP38014.1 DUF1684 domain-containing protein [Calidifontibacter sp. DB2511S]
MTTQDVRDDTALQQDWQDWHRDHEARRADPHGFLAITGLNFLDDFPQRVPDAPGEWSVADDQVVVQLQPGEHLLLDGEPLEGRHILPVIPERGGLTLISGDTAIEVATRGGLSIVRPRRPDHPLVREYAGTPAFPVSHEWVLPGHYEPFAEPQPTTVGAAVDGLEHVYDAPGRITFEYKGIRHTVLAFPGKDDGLQILFTDATAGRETVDSVRGLSVAAPSATGEVVLDFNRAVNLPCAYTPHATCPLPPAQNRLPFEVRAGEQQPAGAAR